MIERPQNVRVATHADREVVLESMIRAYEENALVNQDKAHCLATIDPDRVMEFVNSAFDRKGGVIGVIGTDRIEAHIAIALSQWWYSSDWHLEELSSFVHPDFRRSTHAKSLLQFGKWFSEKMSDSVPTPLFIGILNGERMEAKVRLYQRQFTMRGALFYYDGGSH